MISTFFAFLLFVFLNTKIIDLSDIKLSNINQEDIQDSNLYIQEVIKIVGREQKLKDQVTYDYIANCHSNLQNFEEESFFFDTKANLVLDDSIYKVFLLLNRLYYLRKLSIDLMKINVFFMEELLFLRKELKSIIENINHDEDYYFLKNFISESLLILNHNDSTIFNNFCDNNNENESDFSIFNFYSNVKNPFNKLFFTLQKYYFKCFSEINFSYQKQPALCKELNIFQIEANQNIDVMLFKKNAESKNLDHSVQLIFIDFYFKQLKYFLHNLFFLSSLKSNDENLKYEFDNNLKNLFNTYYFASMFVGQCIYFNNVDEFLGINKVGNFLKYDKILTLAEFQDAFIFFKKLNHYSEMNNVDRFDIDSLINFMQEKIKLIEFPQGIESIFNFIFSYNVFVLNKKKEVKNKKNSFSNLNKGCSSNQISYEYDDKLLDFNNYKNFQLKTTNKQNNGKKLYFFDLNFFISSDKFCCELLKKKVVFSLGIKLNAENIFFGSKLSVDFEFLKFSIHYFFKSFFSVSFSFNIYENLSFIFAFSSQKFYLGFDYFFGSKKICLDINLNYLF